ncbi:MAG TPA: 50S ribosomal protein L4 [Bryobacteraceae bacterium]|nr:50S ribosomal protein L4 [Bryobacteraceae bacterium]
MATVDVFDLRNQVVGSVELSDDVFGAEVNENLIYEAVRHYRASLRGGNAKTKTRHEVSGSGKKLWKQKGTGRARTGSIRSPLWRHGGTVHGPVVRSYAYKLPRKMLLGALRSALSAKLRDGELKIVQSLDTGDHKTKSLATALGKLEAANRKVLLVDVFASGHNESGSGVERNLMLASRNLEGVKLVPTREVTVYDLLAHKQVVISEAAARKFSEALAV